VTVPYGITQGGGTCSPHEWAVINQHSGRTMGCHPTKQAATAQLHALYANEPDTKNDDPPIHPKPVGQVAESHRATQPTRLTRRTTTTSRVRKPPRHTDKPGYGTH
jgi:hypothetical protein